MQVLQYAIKCKTVNINISHIVQQPCSKSSEVHFILSSWIFHLQTESICICSKLTQDCSAVKEQLIGVQWLTMDLFCRNLFPETCLSWASWEYIKNKCTISTESTFWLFVKTCDVQNNNIYNFKTHTLPTIYSSTQPAINYVINMQ